MNIILCGVGGQGTVLASRAIGTAAIAAGLHVRTSEIIGMAQREGAVVSQVRVGPRLYGPLIPDEGADFLLGFELAETARNLNKMAPGGLVLANIQKVIPPTVYLGTSVYNENELISYLRAEAPGLILLDALALAREAGSAKTVSAVMLGAFAAKCPELEEDLVLDGLISRLPEKVRSVNTQAFGLGKNFVEVEMR